MGIVLDMDLSIHSYLGRHRAQRIIFYNVLLKVITEQINLKETSYFVCLAINEPARHLKRRVFLSTVNSILAGMVAVAGGAVAYNPWSAVVIGAIAALSFLIWSKLLIKLQVDDPVETAAGKMK